MNRDIIYCPHTCEELIEYMGKETTFFCSRYDVKLESNFLNPERCFMCRNNRNEKPT